MVAVTLLGSLSLSAQCPAPRHDGDDWVATSTDRYRAIVVKIAAPSPTERATLSGCVFDAQTHGPLKVSFEIFRFDDTREKKLPPRLNDFKQYDKNGTLETIGEILDVESTESGQVILEGLVSGSYAVVPKWPPNVTFEKIGVDLDIRYTTDIDIPLEPTAQLHYPG